MLLEVTLTILLFTAAFTAIEVIKRKTKIPYEVTRKSAHVIGALGAAIMPYFISWSSIAVVAGFFVVAMLVSKRLNVFSSIHKVRRKTMGEMYMPLAVLILALTLRDTSIYFYALAVLAISDSAAAMVGGAWGKRKLVQDKTVLGSLSFLVATFIIGLLILHGALVTSLVVAVAATFAELVSPNGSDNLTIPLTVAVLASWLT